MGDYSNARLHYFLHLPLLHLDVVSPSCEHDSNSSMEVNGVGDVYCILHGPIGSKTELAEDFLTSIIPSLCHLMRHRKPKGTDAMPPLNRTTGGTYPILKMSVRKNPILKPARQL
jgi:hypothetical protein